MQLSFTTLRVYEYALLQHFFQVFNLVKMRRNDAVSKGNVEHVKHVVRVAKFQILKSKSYSLNSVGFFQFHRFGAEILHFKYWPSLEFWHTRNHRIRARYRTFLKKINSLQVFKVGNGKTFHKSRLQCNFSKLSNIRDNSLQVEMTCLNTQV